MDLNYFDKILYINLEHRKDREKVLLKELKKQKVKRSKIKRIEGGNEPLNGRRGCAIGHIRALDFAIDNQLQNVLILEDDSVFSEYDKVCSYLKMFFDFYKNNWDVFLLGANVFQKEKTKHRDISRVLIGLCTHAYVVNSHYFGDLRDCFFSAYSEMKNDVFFTQSKGKAIDMKWIDLQVKDKWYIGNNMITQQDCSLSDIENRVKNVTCKVRNLFAK